MKNFLRTITILAFVSVLSLTVFADPISFSGKNCYFGVLHAHTVLSPDFLPQPGNINQFKQLVASTADESRFQIPNGPYLAYRRGAEAAKLDFLALTDHVHGPENGQSEFCDHEMPPGGYRLTIDSAAKINNDPAFRGKFLAIPGMEWSTISSGNHLNIFFARNAVPQSIPNGNFRGLFDNYFNADNFERNNPNLLVQMNHPNQESVNKNFGRNRFPGGVQNDRDFAAFYKNTYLAIEHINNSDNGNNNSAEANAHRNGDDLRVFYRRYLNMGFRLAPIGDHDNHRANWGRHTAARTAVWADELTAEKFTEAYKARRVYATEDNELAVAFLSQGKWMGSEVAVPAAGETRTFTVMITQMADTDTGQVQNEGPYIIELFGDEDGIGGNEAERLRFTFNGQLRSSIEVVQGATVQFTRPVKAGEYYYLHVREKNGRDAGGEEADAWTAPIFFVQ